MLRSLVGYETFHRYYYNCLHLLARRYGRVICRQLFSEIMSQHCSRGKAYIRAAKNLHFKTLAHRTGKGLRQFYTVLRKKQARRRKRGH